MNEDIIYWDDPVLKRGMALANANNIEEKHKKLLKKIDRLLSKGNILKARSIIDKSL